MPEPDLPSGLRRVLGDDGSLLSGEVPSLNVQGREIDAALAVVADDPPPARSSLFDDIYETRPWNLAEQADG